MLSTCRWTPVPVFAASLVSTKNTVHMTVFGSLWQVRHWMEVSLRISHFFLRKNGPCLFGLLVSPEKYEKLNSSRIEWRTCTFLHTVPRYCIALCTVLTVLAQEHADYVKVQMSFPSLFRCWRFRPTSEIWVSTLAICPSRCRFPSQNRCWRRFVEVLSGNRGPQGRHLPLAKRARCESGEIAPSSTQCGAIGDSSFSAAGALDGGELLPIELLECGTTPAGGSREPKL